MDENKTELTSPEDDWSDLFGVDYFADEAEETPTEEADEDDAKSDAAEEAPTEESTADAEQEEDPEEDVTALEETAVEEDEEGNSEAVGETDQVGTEDPKPDVEVNRILEELKGVDPAIESFNDLEDIGLFASLLDSGKPPREALLESSPKLRSRMTAAQKAASKSHLRATAASAREDAIDMDAINAFRAVKPNVSEKEAIALYKKVRAR